MFHHGGFTLALRQALNSTTSHGGSCAVSVSSRKRTRLDLPDPHGPWRCTITALGCALAASSRCNRTNRAANASANGLRPSSSTVAGLSDSRGVRSAGGGGGAVDGPSATSACHAATSSSFSGVRRVRATIRARNAASLSDEGWPPSFSGGHCAAWRSASANIRWRRPSGSGSPLMVRSRISTARGSTWPTTDRDSTGTRLAVSGCWRRVKASPSSLAQSCSHVAADATRPVVRAVSSADTSASISTTSSLRSGLAKSSAVVSAIPMLSEMSPTISAACWTRLAAADTPCAMRAWDGSLPEGVLPIFSNGGSLTALPPAG